MRRTSENLHTSLSIENIFFAHFPLAYKHIIYIFLLKTVSLYFDDTRKAWVQMNLS